MVLASISTAALGIARSAHRVGVGQQPAIGAVPKPLTHPGFHLIG